MIELRPLNELCDQIVDCPHSTPVWTDQGVVVLRSHNIRNGRLDLSDASYTDEQHYKDRTRRAVPQPGDLVITREAPMGEICMIPAGLKCCLGQRMVLLRPSSGRIVGRYLLFAIQSPAVQHEIGVNEGTGSTVSNLRIPVLEQLKIPTPSLTVQNRIADILGSLDDKIELNRRTNETLEAMARTLFRSWFVDFDPVRAKADGQTPPGLDAATAKLFPDTFEPSAIGPIPKGWRVEPLDGIAEFLNGLALQKYPPEEGKPSLPVIKIAQLNAGSTLNAYRANTDVPSQYVIKDGDLLFSWSGSLEVVIWCGGEGALNQHLFKVTTTKWPKWLVYQWLLEHLPDFRRIAAAKATTMGHIQRHHLNDAKVVLPPPDVLRAATGIVSPLIQRVVAHNVESRTLAATRDALLPKLLSGEFATACVSPELSPCPSSSSIYSVRSWPSGWSTSGSTTT